MSKTQKTRAPKLDIRAWRVEVVDAAQTSQKAAFTMFDTMVALVLRRYGPCLINPAPQALNDDCTRAAVGGPSKADYDEDQKQFAELAKARGLASNQWVRKPYAAAVKSVYGTLPITETAEALAERQRRKAGGASTGHANAAEVQQPAKAGRTEGETQERRPSKAEQIEQVVTSYGIPATMEAIARILDGKPDTALAAKTMRALVEEMRGGAPVDVKLNTRAKKSA